MKILPCFLVSVTCLLVTPLQARIWTSADGTNRTEAQFISASDGRVTFQKPDGKRITFALDKLSAEDQAWVQEMLASKPAPGTPENTAKTGAEKSNEYTKQLTGKWERLEDAELKYRLYGERKLKGSKLYPLVIYLHGRGGDVMTPEVPGQASDFAKAANYHKRPCFIIAPQCPTDGFWSGNNSGNVIKVIETLVKKLPVDGKRIYITGYSMGGYGTFDIVAKEPKLFAAAVPVAGGGNPATASSMKRVPFWVFHGDADTVVNVGQSRQMVDALKQAGGQVDYTEIPGGSHGIIGQVYQDEKLHEWMFEQTQGKKAGK
ncbi:MAG: prolyl oligopeptidase family serine peptidase [Verrucomicrobia bacterium]|nr:prolyl oligopeptidase family serine peptidase [Verrucomicrobiota bacterium]